jgi:hypothetical protein
MLVATNEAFRYLSAQYIQDQSITAAPTPVASTTQAAAVLAQDTQPPINQQDKPIGFGSGNSDPSIQGQDEAPT